MLVTEATWIAFAAFSGLRTISYVPQIVRIARDRNGASAISYPTWLLWTGAHASTGLYAAMNLNDVWLAVGSSIYALCCIVVLALTVFKRSGQRRAKDARTALISHRHESDQKLGPSLLGYRSQKHETQFNIDRRSSCSAV